jgi:predicted nuclease of predicted toxin-antitoxin system
MKFLVDECLSPELTKLAHAKGHGESSHVVWLDRAGLKDWELKPIILDGDWTFVTKNSVDFRGPAERPLTRGQYSDVALHAGLVCLNGPPGMDLDMQTELFEQALEELEANADLVNQVLEITWEEEALHTRRYELPAVEP